MAAVGSPLRLFLQPNDAQAEAVATVLAAGASLKELVALARHAFGLPGGVLGSGRDWSVARLYLPNGASVNVEDLYDDDQVTVAFEGEPFFGAVEGSAWSLSTLLQPPGVNQKAPRAEPPAPLLLQWEQMDLAAPKALAKGGRPFTREAPSDALLDPSLPRSRSEAAPTRNPLSALRDANSFFSSLPPHLRLRILAALLACLGIGAAGRLALYVAWCDGDASASGAHANATAGLDFPPDDTACWASSHLDAAGRGLGWGAIVSVLGAADLLRREKLLSPPRLVDGRVYGVLLRDWVRVGLVMPLCTLLGAVLGLILTRATEQGITRSEQPLPSDEGGGASSQWHPAPRAHPDGLGLGSPGEEFNFNNGSLPGGAPSGARFGFLVGLFLALVLLMDVLQLKPGAAGLSAGALDRTRLRHKLRSLLSPFEGRNGAAMVNALAAAALGCVLLFFVSVAAAASLEAWRPDEHPGCLLDPGIPMLNSSLERLCKPGLEQCQVPPLWMRPTFFQAIREAAALQPLPSPPAARAYGTPIGGARGGGLIWARERLLSSSAAKYDVQVCWRQGAPRLQMMPDVLAVNVNGWEVGAGAEVSVAGREHAGSAGFFGRRLQHINSAPHQPQPDMQSSQPDYSQPDVEYSSYGYLWLLIALDVQPDESPAFGGAPLLPGTVANNSTGAEACGGHFDRARAIARGRLRSQVAAGAELAEAVDAAAVAAASRVASRLCFGDAHPGNASGAGAVGDAVRWPAAEPSAQAVAHGPAGSSPSLGRRVLLAEEEGLRRWGLAYDLPLVLSEHLPRLRQEAAAQVRLVWAVVTAGLLVFGLAVSVLLCMRCCGNVAAGAHAFGCCCVKVEGHFDGKAQGCCCIYFLPPRTRSADVHRPYDKFFSGGSIDGTDAPIGSEQQEFWQSAQREEGGPFMSAVRRAVRSAGQMAAAPLEVLRNMFQSATIARSVGP
jgi:hypothetical protein